MLIGLSGKLRTGKDTVASMVCNKYKFDRYALADELRVFCKKLFKAKTVIEYDEIYQYIQQIFKDCASNLYIINKTEDSINKCFAQVVSDRKKFTYINGDKNRSILQHFGEVIRSYEPYFWIQALISKLNLENNNIITDIRLFKEFKKLKNCGFNIVRISASNDVRKKILGDNQISQINHSTELELDSVKEWDYFIFNNGDLSDLEVKALDMVKFFEENHA